MRIVQITDALPDGFNGLLKASIRENIRNMSLLAESWDSGKERFDGIGEALYSATTSSGKLVGIAGISREHSLLEEAMRMRRLYVTPAFRRQGVARQLAQVCIQKGFTHADVLTCNARASLAAAPFWEALEFQPVKLPNITHCRRKK